MNRLWVGVAAGLLAATALVGVGVGAYRAGQDDDNVTRIVTEEGERDGEVVRVVERDGWHRGPGFGFFLFPLLIVGGIFLIARAGRGHWHHGDYGHGYGYGPGGQGGPGRWGPPDERARDWHRRLHEEEETPQTTDSP